MKSIATAADMALIKKIFPFTSPEKLPISFAYGDRVIHGLPAEFNPQMEARMVDANKMQYIVRGQDADGLEIRVECLEYRDYAATEYLAFFTNKGDKDTKLISDVKIVDGVLGGSDMTLVYGNGDTLKEDGYEWFRDSVRKGITLSPTDGTSCNGAFPYMRLVGKDFGVNIAVGWPAMWKAGFSAAENGVHLTIGQLRCRMVLHPGETMRTPRANFVAYTGDEMRGINMWRRWYLTHILPREDGKPIPPKCCMHVFEADGHPEFTGASEENQIGGIEDYISNGIRPDIWWIDAGWYPCNYNWTTTGTWKPDERRFPDGLGPIGKKCDENGMQLLLWFEPERVRRGTELEKEHPEWLLMQKLSEEEAAAKPVWLQSWKDGESPYAENALLNLGNKDCCNWLIERVDGIIKDSGVRIYRQDFNFDPKPIWEQAEAKDRIGAIENFHVQGYLRYWDALIARNPGLWIDSCASGGRRNDLETMRRAVPLHYTDVGYGNHPIKQKQHREMFEWIPYFRAHNTNWDDPVTGEYGKTNLPIDRFAYYVAMTPALTDTTAHDASEADFAMARQMQAIWRKAAELMLAGDYYPLTECRKSAADFYAMQFHDPDTENGFVEIIRNNACEEEAFTAQLQALDKNAIYLLTEAESGETTEFTGAELARGLRARLPKRSGRIYFYERKQR